MLNRNYVFLKTLVKEDIQLCWQSFVVRECSVMCPELCTFKHRRTTSSTREVTQDFPLKNTVLYDASDTNTVDYEK